MTAKEKYDKAFMDSFSLTSADLNDQLAYESVPDWDSVGHMGLMSELEDLFSIEMDADDIIDFSSYPIGKQILKKYDVEID